VLLPRQVYLAGIVAPSANAGLRTEIADGLADVAGLAGVPWVPGVAAGADRADGVGPPPVPPQAASESTPIRRAAAREAVRADPPG
jgi:hypothetical protein